MKLSNPIFLAFLALVTASTIWGINTSVMKLTLQTIPVFTLAFVRFGIASIILFPFVLHKLTFAKRDLPKIFLAGICAVTLNIGFFFWGIKLTTALNAGIIVASTPILSLLAARFFLKESITLKLVLGMLLGTTGIAFIIGKDLFGHTVLLSPLGDLLIILSSLAFVVYETISKSLTKSYNSFALTYCFFAIGALSFLPLAIIENIQNPVWIFSLSKTAIFGIAFGILFSSLSAYSLWEWGLSKIPESKVAFFFYLDPIVSTVTATVLLSEKITFPFVVGAICIFAGIFLAEGHLPYHHLHKPEQI